MAIARCNVHAGDINKPYYYERHCLPVGVIICGRGNCENRGNVWLNVKEASEYEDGQRVFKLAEAAKIEVH